TGRAARSPRRAPRLPACRRDEPGFPRRSRTDPSLPAGGAGILSARSLPTRDAALAPFASRRPSSAPGDALAVQIAIVDHPLRLEFRARQRSLRHQLQPRTDADACLQSFAHVALQCGGIVPGGDLDADEQIVHRLAARDDDAELATE